MSFDMMAGKRTNNPNSDFSKNVVSRAFSVYGFVIPGSNLYHVSFEQRRFLKSMLFCRSTSLKRVRDENSSSSLAVIFLLEILVAPVCWKGYTCSAQALDFQAQLLSGPLDVSAHVCAGRIPCFLLCTISLMTAPG